MYFDSSQGFVVEIKTLDIITFDFSDSLMSLIRRFNLFFEDDTSIKYKSTKIQYLKRQN